MFGQILSAAVKTVTLPIDVAEKSIDIMAGGDGSKQSVRDGGGFLSEIRDSVTDAIEEIDG